MNPSDPLSELRGLHLPNEIGNWPPALGWWLLTLLSLILIVGGTVLLIRRIRKNAYRRAALKELALLEQQFQSASASEFSSSAFQRALVELLKRTSLTAFPRTAVAGLSGEPWLISLDESANMQDFNSELGQHLVVGRFSEHPPTLDVECAASLLRISRMWIKKHR